MRRKKLKKQAIAIMSFGIGLSLWMLAATYDNGVLNTFLLGVVASAFSFALGVILTKKDDNSCFRY